MRPPSTHFGMASANGLNYRIDGVGADATGGWVKVSFIGHESCQGHEQHAKFSWRFMPNISRLAVYDGRQAFTVYLNIEGDHDNCMNLNPFFMANEYGDALWRAPGGEARFYEFPHSFHLAGPRVYTYRYRQDQPVIGFEIDIPLPSLPNVGGDMYSVDYRFDGIDNNAKLFETFTNPMADGYRVDRCLRFSSGCGKPAADAFCRSKGYLNAVDWKWEAAAPTKPLGDTLICKDATQCAAFSEIRCRVVTTR